MQTWIVSVKNHNYDFYFVSGDDIDVPNLIKIDFKESYDQLPLKTYLGLKAIKDFDYTHVVKTDDDTFVNVEELTKHFKDFDYIGKFNNPSNNSNNIHFFKCSDDFKRLKKPAKYSYAEGGFYILSKKAVDHITSFNEALFYNTPETYRGEDVFIGELLNENFTKIDINTEYSKLYNMDITYNGVSLHPVDSNLMKSLYKLPFEFQLKILRENSNLNDYNKRDKYLSQL